MILSVCPTTTLERNWIIPKFSIGGFHRVQQELLFASGKGVNAARVIKILHGQVICTGFTGGFTGQLFKSLAVQEGIQGCWTEAGIETRESITVYDPETSLDATSFCPSGPAIKESEWERFFSQLYDLAENVQNIAISGNIPPGISEGKFTAVIAELSCRGKQVWLDINGSMLAAGAKAAPFAIKVNAKEISELAGQPVQDRAGALEICKTLRNTYEIPLISVTLGSRGAVCSSERGDWLIDPLDYPKIISPVGCGDAFLGGILVRYDEGADLETCLRSGAAAAGASTQKLGPGNFELSDYELALQRAVIERVG
ncbi:MAG: 1-phosphofructokinase family hexose kinase [Omnitrophica WOR_2 bacterium]